ncbi:MAG: hypothetical protein KBS68_05765 [Clostridiales bacterium]|nr:hypothetical protein [Candidatus Crickella merdequi]
MYFEVSKEVFDKLPNAVFGAVAVKGVDNTKMIPELAEMTADGVADCAAYIGDVKPKNLECVTPYRDAFKALGINPNRYSCSIEALMDRIAKGRDFPAINAVVDLGNAISVKYKLPIGAHDIDTFDGGLEVRPAGAEDIFITFDGQEDNPEAGEVVYVTGHEVRTRRWTWRQGANGMITEGTTNVLFPIDGFKDFNMAEVEAAIEDFKAMIAQYFGDVEVTSTIIDADNRRFEF